MTEKITVVKTGQISYNVEVKMDYYREETSCGKKN
jgi:hypothetical protein